mmetsp:Transcript_6880/g.28189  ORF Transcript_6880/g.28189 Transcript_6880/m.28189 type:complete len:201 (+) Transcript_6880:877-1479(+)
MDPGKEGWNEQGVSGEDHAWYGFGIPNENGPLSPDAATTVTPRKPSFASSVSTRSNKFHASTSLTYEGRGLFASSKPRADAEGFGTRAEETPAETRSEVELSRASETLALAPGDSAPSLATGPPRFFARSAASSSFVAVALPPKSSPPPPRAISVWYVSSGRSSGRLTRGCSMPPNVRLMTEGGSRRAARFSTTSSASQP